MRSSLSDVNPLHTYPYGRMGRIATHYIYIGIYYIGMYVYEIPPFNPGIGYPPPGEAQYVPPDISKVGLMLPLHLSDI